MLTIPSDTVNLCDLIRIAWFTSHSKWHNICVVTERPALVHSLCTYLSIHFIYIYIYGMFNDKLTFSHLFPVTLFFTQFPSVCIYFSKRFFFLFQILARATHTHTLLSLTLCSFATKHWNIFFAQWLSACFDQCKHLCPYTYTIHFRLSIIAAVPLRKRRSLCKYDEPWSVTENTHSLTQFESLAQN